MRPLIVRVHIYTPKGDAKHSLVAARGHLRYMDNPKKEELVTDVEALREQGDDEAAIHARYMSARPGSQGLFGPDSRRPPDQTDVLREIRSHRGPVWRIIVSVHEDDVRAMGGGLYHRAAWEDAVRGVLPRMAHEMGIAVGDLRWATAMHRKVGPEVIAAGKTPTCHVHILLWSKDPAKGFLSRDGLEKARRAWTSALYAPERERLGAEKSKIRSAIGARFRQAMTREETDAFARQLLGIAQMLPGHGRLAYGYMPVAVKQRVDAAVEHMLQANPEMAQLVQRYGAIAAEMASHYSYNVERHDSARQNALADLHRRLGGAVLQAAVAMDERTAWQSIANDVSHATRGGTEASAVLTAPVRAEVSSLASAPSREEAIAAARRVLATPELASRMQLLIERAARRGPVDGAADRIARAQARLEATVASRLLRSAEYVRDLRRWEVVHAFAGIGRALIATLKEAEGEAKLAEARTLEEAARQKRRAAEEEYAR